MARHMFEYCLGSVFNRSAKNKTLFCFRDRHYSWKKKLYQWPLSMATGSTNVIVSFFLNVKSRLDLLDLLAPFLGAYCIRSEPADFFFISGHRAVVPCSFAEICYVILVHNERASIFTFFRNTLFKYLTQNHHGRIQRELWHISAGVPAGFM